MLSMDPAGYLIAFIMSDQPCPLWMTPIMAGYGFTSSEPVDRVEALLANTVSARLDPDGALDAALAAAARARGLHGARAEARPAAASLLRRLDALTG